METEEYFLVFASLMLLLDLIQLSRSKSREKSKLEYGFYAVTLACALIVVSYVLLVQAFLTSNFSFVEVYTYTSSSLPLLSKFYATWSGASSSMLFLTFIVAVGYFVYRFRTYEKKTLFTISVYGITDFVLLFFLIVTLMNSPFQRYSSVPMDGQGLNPLLQTFWMFAHPPIVFLGYVLIIFTFIFALAEMSSREKANPRTRKLLLQTAWLTSTVGIVLGGLWAYEVLGWGGYWGWDPVETGSLLPWLALTAYFHAAPLSKVGKSLTRELMILVAFVSVIFTTALTRGGLLVSVHAFGTSPVGPVLLLFALGMTVYFLYLGRKTKLPLFSVEADKSSLYSVSLFVGFWSLIFIFLVCAWGVAVPIIAGVFTANPMAVGPDFYNTWTFPFALAFVVALMGCSVFEKVGFKKFLAFVVGPLVAGIVFVEAGFPTPNVLANLGMPFLIVGLCAVTYRLVQLLPKKRRSLKSFGRNLLHFSIILTLIGVFISATAKQSSGQIVAKPNTVVETLGVRIELGNFTSYTGRGHVYSIMYSRDVSEYSTLKLDVTIKSGGSTYNEALWIYFYPIYGVTSTPLIIKTWTGDVYVRLMHTESMYNAMVQGIWGNQTLPDDLILSVDMNPWIGLVWTGATLMSIGIAIPLIKELVGTVRRSKKTENTAGPAT